MSGFFRICLAVCACVASSWAAEEAVLGSGFRVLYSVYRQCDASADPFNCLKGRAVKLVDRAIHADSIPILDGMSLVRRPESERSLKNPLEPLPNEIEPRKVDELLWDRVTAFMETHSVQFKLPTFIQDAIYDDSTVDEEGRGKKKRLMPALLMGLLLKGSMLAMAMKGLALLAGKALIVSKMALVLAGVIALKKLFSGGNEKTTYEIVKQPIVSHSHQYSTSHEYGGNEGGGGGGYEHGGYGRSMNLNNNHHDIVYSAHSPASRTLAVENKEEFAPVNAAESQ